MQHSEEDQFTSTPGARLVQMDFLDSMSVIFTFSNGEVFGMSRETVSRFAMEKGHQILEPEV